MKKKTNPVATNADENDYDYAGNDDWDLGEIDRFFADSRPDFSSIDHEREFDALLAILLNDEGESLFRREDEDDALLETLLAMLKEENEFLIDQWRSDEEDKKLAEILLAELSKEDE